MDDKKIDLHRKGIPPELWRSMRASAIEQGISIAEWLTEAIKMKLEKEHEK